MALNHKKRCSTSFTIRLMLKQNSDAKMTKIRVLDNRHLTKGKQALLYTGWESAHWNNLCESNLPI